MFSELSTHSSWIHCIRALDRIRGGILEVYFDRICEKVGILERIWRWISKFESICIEGRQISGALFDGGSMIGSGGFFVSSPSPVWCSLLFSISCRIDWIVQFRYRSKKVCPFIGSRSNLWWYDMGFGICFLFFVDLDLIAVWILERK